MLSKKTKYGIKALTYLARKEQKEPVPIAEISNATILPPNFIWSLATLY